MEPEALFKLLADRNRLRILALLERGEPCVCDLEAGLGISQANLSRHLARLRAAGLVAATRRGAFVYYRRLDPAVAGAAAHALAGAYQALAADPGFDDDRCRLAAFVAAKPASLCP